MTEPDENAADQGPPMSIRLPVVLPPVALPAVKLPDRPIARPNVPVPTGNAHSWRPWW